MESLGRLQYGKEDVVDVETDVSHTVKMTITQGLNDGGVLCFRLPADPERFTDLNTILLRLEVETKKADGSDTVEEDLFCLDLGGMHSLFSTCDIRFNDEIVSTMTAYPYTTALSRFLGCSGDIRDGVWDTLDGTHSRQYLRSQLTEDSKGYVKGKRSRILKNGVLIGRIYSDILTSSRQYLPPGVTLGIELRRAPDHFSLIGFGPENYKLRIKTASIYARRMKIRQSLIPKVIESLKEGCGIDFNRLETRIKSISAGNQGDQWLDCINGASLPNRLYVAFVAQKSLYGHLEQHSTYFENLNLSSLNVKLGGRDLLVEPIKMEFSKTAAPGNELITKTSNGMEGFLTIAEVLNLVGDQIQPLRLNYASYMSGLTFYAIELGKCGGKIGASGCLDLEFTFGQGGTDMEGSVLLFTEKSEKAPIHPRHV